MKLIKQSYEILRCPENVRFLEGVARTCYKSEHKIAPGSDVKLVKSLVDRGHLAMIEFEDVTVKFITNRGVTHELVRHRLCSFAQESTRYVRYNNDMEFIEPVWWEGTPGSVRKIFTSYLELAEEGYKDMLDCGWQPQQARELLPNALKTEINVKANLTEWRHIFKMRCSKKAHPQMRNLMMPFLNELKSHIPVVFDDMEFQ